MAGASEDGEANHWPAFVDVLTAVIMVVTFLLVIMSAAIMHLSKRTVEVMQQKIELLQDSRRAAEAVRTGKSPADGGGTQDTGAIGLKPISSPRDAAAGSSIAQLGSPLVSETIVNGKDSLSILTRDTPDTQRIRVKSAEQPKETRGAQVTSSSTLLRVDFDADAIRYTDEDARKVLDFLKGSVRPGTKYEVWSMVGGAGSVSEPMRIAFYRAATTRNLLIQAGIKPGDIVTQSRVVDPTSGDGNSVRIVVKN
ncbi:MULTISPECIES: hypothetical protein [Sphingomonas]|uniref:Uncharacterized protein n=1 Tax=Sphingomonas adhaesiva TaxID=28212 RepID=A0A2A4I8N9_9SPHN|nr:MULTISPECIES: hypothetical protein [Sphingomonas]PCG14152.1 hypothetical protein COA07_10095 [Sphingomonas adhaesiva]PZU81132.1 MAG: hypothetical protein DI530_03045 [Sphingomonas sp.]